MDLHTIVTTIHLFVTFSLCGLIWTIQLVHYPTFLFINQKVFNEFATFHSSQITKIVAPLMILELLSGVYLFWSFPSLTSGISFALIIFIWLSTAFISVPLHKKLYNAYDVTVVHKLIHTNWLRTIFWSIRSILLISFAKVVFEY